MPDLWLLLVACQYPGGVLDRTPLVYAPDAGPASLKEWALPRGPADAGVDSLREYLRRAPHPNATATRLALGDQIYVDATAGLFDPRNQDAPFERLNQERTASPAWAEVFSGQSVIALMDDHEIVDNWEPSADPARNLLLRQQMETARAAFIQWQRPGAAGPLWFTTQLQASPGTPAALFVGDTRTEREARSPITLTRARIMGAAQESALQDFLLTRAGDFPFTFVATSSMVLPRLLATCDTVETPGTGSQGPSAYPGSIESDAWDGYPASLHWLLGLVLERGTDDVVFLSGNEHIGMVARITLRRGNKTVTAWSVHAGALYAPYPFANATRFDFADVDTFSFRTPAGEATCTVETWFPDMADGFCSLTVTAPAGGRPELRVEYHPADGSAMQAWQT